MGRGSETVTIESTEAGYRVSWKDPSGNEISLVLSEDRNAKRLARVLEKAENTASPWTEEQALSYMAFYEKYYADRSSYQSRLRRRVLERDNGVCVGCGTENEIQVAHLVPVNELIKYMDMAGAHDPRLAVCLCKSCHRILDKDGMSAELQGEMDSLMGLREELYQSGHPGKYDKAMASEEVKDLNRKMHAVLERGREHYYRLQEACEAHLSTCYSLKEEKNPVQCLLSQVLLEFTDRYVFWYVPYQQPKINTTGWRYSKIIKLFYAPKDTEPTAEMEEKGTRIDNVPRFVIDKNEEKLEGAKKRRKRQRAQATRKHRKWINELKMRYTTILGLLQEGPKTIRVLTDRNGVMDENTVRAALENGKNSLKRRGYVRSRKIMVNGRRSTEYIVTPEGIAWLEDPDSEVELRAMSAMNMKLHNWKRQ